MMTHAAYNLTPGEIIMIVGSGNSFKRRIASVQRCDHALGYGKGRWIWAHGKDAVEKVCAKAVAIQKRG